MKPQPPTLNPTSIGDASAGASLPQCQRFCSRSHCAVQWPGGVARCLRSLAGGVAAIGEVAVVDNGELQERNAGGGVPPICQSSRTTRRGPWVSPGLTWAMRGALKRHGDRITHFLIMDDDVELSPNTLSAMLAAGVDVSCPLVTGSDERIGWFPRLTAPGPWETDSPGEEAG